MKSKHEWTKLIRDDVDLRLAKGETPERVDDLIADWLGAVQADAAADMRERAAKVVEKRDLSDSSLLGQLTGISRRFSAAIRALPLEES